MVAVAMAVDVQKFKTVAARDWCYAAILLMITKEIFACKMLFAYSQLWLSLLHGRKVTTCPWPVRWSNGDAAAD